MMVDLKGKNILCNTKEEVEAILKEAIDQKSTWCTGLTINLHDLGFDIIPVVLCFDNSIKLSWSTLEDCNDEEYFVTDLAKDLLNVNSNKEMTAHEFLNKFLDMAYHCSNCQECKTIKANGFDYKWCDSDLWTKDNIDQVYEIVKSGNKLKEKSEKIAINNLEELLVNLCDEEYTKSLKLAIKALEEKLNEKQK